MGKTQRWGLCPSFPVICDRTVGLRGLGTSEQRSLLRASVWSWPQSQPALALWGAEPGSCVAGGHC